MSDYPGIVGEQAGDYMIQEQFEPVMKHVFEILGVHKIDVFHKSANDFAILLPAGMKVDEKAFRKALDLALAELQIENTLYYSHPAFGITDVEFVKTENIADDLVKNMALIGAALGRLATAVNVDTLKSIDTHFFINGTPQQGLPVHHWDWLRRYLSTDEVLEKRGRIRLTELGVTEDEMSALGKVEYTNGEFITDEDVATAGEWQKMIGGFVYRYTQIQSPQFPWWQRAWNTVKKWFVGPVQQTQNQLDEEKKIPLATPGPIDQSLQLRLLPGYQELNPSRYLTVKGSFSDGRVVVVKGSYSFYGRVLSVAEQERHVTNLRNEVEILKRLNGAQNVPQFIGDQIGGYPQSAYNFAMTVVPGENLNSPQIKSLLTTQQKIELIKQLISYARDYHARMISHGDWKLEQFISVFGF